MRNRILLAMMGLVLLLALAACGEKSKDDVSGALSKKIKDMTGYKVTATMTLKTGPSSQKYDVEVWHSKPDYYRVALQNDGKSQSQMILRNNEGVFVITPSLNKSYRFESDWPLNSSQVYLYESLIRDVTKDKGAKFKSTKDTYVFETKTNYNNNKALPAQEISFDKGSLAPKNVKIKDADGNVVVNIDFKQMKFNPRFGKDAFDTKRNMTSMKLGEKELAVSEEPLAVMYPLLTMNGVDLIEEKEMSTDNGTRYILTYGGEKNFTIIEEKAVVKEASVILSASGEPVDLGFTVGVHSGSMLTWTYEGVQFTLASTDLSSEEMISVAQSIQGQSMK